MIGEEIRRRRQEKGWTGVQLAEKAGMAPSAVSQIETGRRSPHSASVIKLAAALGCEVADLYPKAPQTPLPLDLDAHPPASGIEVLGSHFVEPEPGEEPDTVTIEIRYVRLMGENDRLLRRVRELERENAALREHAGSAQP